MLEKYPDIEKLVRETEIIIQKKNRKIPKEIKKKAEAFVSKYTDLFEEFFNHYFDDWEKYRHFKVEKDFEQDMFELIDLEVSEAIEFIKTYYSSLHRLREEWGEHFFEIVYNQILTSQNILVLLLSDFMSLIREANLDDGMGYDCESAVLALEAIGNIKHEEIIPLLGEYLFYHEVIYSDSEAYFDDAVCIRKTAADLLGKHKKEQAVKLLLRSLLVSKGGVIYFTISALGEIGNEKAIVPIYSFLPGIIKKRNPDFYAGDGGFSEFPEFIFVYNKDYSKIAEETLRKMGVEPSMNTGVKILLKSLFLQLSKYKKYDSESIALEGLSKLIEEYPTIVEFVIYEVKDNLIEESGVSEKEFTDIIVEYTNFYRKNFPGIE